MIGRVLLADDSPHAQKIGQRILAGEGLEVEVAVSGQEVYPALERFDPDVAIVDVFLPERSGYEITHWIKTNPRHQAIRVILTAGLLEPIDDNQARDAGCDAILKKPFEATEMLHTVRQLIEAARGARGLFAEEFPAGPKAGGRPIPKGPVPRPAIDPERVKAAVTLALEAAMPAMIEEVTERVLIALGH